MYKKGEAVEVYRAEGFTGGWVPATYTDCVKDVHRSLLPSGKRICTGIACIRPQSGPKASEAKRHVGRAR